MLSLDKITVTPVKIVPVEGGNVMHALKSKDTEFHGFGEVYFSTINPGVVKAWKRHTKMFMNLVVPLGMVQFVFYSCERKEFRVEKIGINNYARITVPPNIWFGFSGIVNTPSLVMNVANIPHDDKEVERLDTDKICFKWI